MSESSKASSRASEIGKASSRASEISKASSRASESSKASSRASEISEWVQRYLPLRRFGWMFLLAWVFCVFYTSIIAGYTGNAESWGRGFALGEHVFFLILPVGMSVLTLVAAVLLEKRWGSPTSHSSMFWIAPLTAAVSTPLLFFMTGNPIVTVAVFVCGAILTGFGSGFLWVMWGEYYARISQEDTESLAPISAVGAAVLVLLVSSMSGWIALAVVTSFPLISGLCLALSWRDVEAAGGHAERSSSEDKAAIRDAHQAARHSLPHVLGSMGRAGLGILVACLFVCIEGTFWSETQNDSLEFQLVIVVSIVFMALVAFWSIKGPRRISISFLYRWMCPALVLGFVALIVFGLPLGGYLAFVVSIAARFAFCLITQMYFARYAVTGKATAVQSYGLGWTFVHLGDLLGGICYIFLGGGMEAGVIGLDQVAAVSIAILVVVTMFVLNDEKSFVSARRTVERESVTAGTETVGQPAAGESGSVGDIDDLGDRIAALAHRFELTPRETEVFDLLARGRSVPYVRDALVISKETAATHAKHIYAKMGVHSRQELIDLVH